MSFRGVVGFVFAAACGNAVVPPAPPPYFPSEGIQVVRHLQMCALR